MIVLKSDVKALEMKMWFSELVLKNTYIEWKEKQKSAYVCAQV